MTTGTNIVLVMIMIMIPLFYIDRYHIIIFLSLGYFGGVPQKNANLLELVRTTTTMTAQN